MTSLWQVTKPVSFLSTSCQLTSGIKVKRRQKDSTRIEVTCPETVFLYNKYMGGVDRNDQMRGCNSVRINQVIYKYIFWFLFDLAITNAFILHKFSPAAEKTMTLKEFRIELAKQLIGSYNSRKYRGTLSGPNSNRIKKNENGSLSSKGYQKQVSTMY